MTYITRSEDHHYTIHANGSAGLLPFDGVTVPGVTGILKVMDKSDALMAWAARMTAEAAVTMGGQLVPLIETVGPQGAIKALTERSGWHRDQAAALGSEVHDLADQLVRGVNVGPWPAHVEKRVIAYAEWWQASGWTLRASEALLVHPGLGYGGTLDLLARDRDGLTVLADIKTGGRIYREVMLQLAAYGNASWLEYAGDLFPMPRVDRYAVLHVTDKGVREVPIAVGDLERKAFAACIEVYRWREATRGMKL